MKVIKFILHALHTLKSRYIEKINKYLNTIINAQCINCLFYNVNKAQMIGLRFINKHVIMSSISEYIFYSLTGIICMYQKQIRNIGAQNNIRNQVCIRLSHKMMLKHIL